NLGECTAVECCYISDCITYTVDSLVFPHGDKHGLDLAPQLCIERLGSGWRRPWCCNSFDNRDSGGSGHASSSSGLAPFDAAVVVTPGCCRRKIEMFRYVCSGLNVYAFPQCGRPDSLHTNNCSTTGRRSPYNGVGPPFAAKPGSKLQRPRGRRQE
ncbi:unnamed protein product, partial [Rangifer tarandus platyrhynchus]